LYIQPHCSFIHEEPYLQVHERDFHIQDIKEFSQPWTSLIYSSHVYEYPFNVKDLTLATIHRKLHLQYETYFTSFQPLMPQQSTLSCGFSFVFSSYRFSNHICVYVTGYIQRGHQSLCRFHLELPSKPLLLENSMSSTDDWCNVEDTNDKYISPVDSWIEEACSSPDEPWCC
jgi:hypothetical protein